DSLPENDAAAIELREHGITFRILDPMGRVIQSFGPLPAPMPSAQQLVPALDQQASFVTVADLERHDPLRIYLAPILENGRVVGIVQLARSLDTVEETLARLLTLLFIGGLLLTILAAFGGYLLAARALAPIDQITRT